MGGVVGRLFREFAITLSVSVIISGILSLILTPMMCAALLEPHDSRPRSQLFPQSERAFGAARDVYEAGLRWSLRHQRLTLGFTVLTFAASIFLYVIIPKGFVPGPGHGTSDRCHGRAQDVSFEAMTALQQKIAGVISEDPDVAGVISFVGVGADNPTINSGRLYIDIGTPEHGTPRPRRLCAGCATRPPKSTTSSFICNRCRTFRSKPVRHPPSSSTYSRISTKKNCGSGPRNFWRS